jgi:phage terminase small subunit
MRGRKPLPSNVKEFRGNPGHRPLNPNEPEPELVKEFPEPPRKLRGDALKEWNRIVPGLVQTRVLAEQELSLLASYCYLHGAVVKAERRGELLAAAYYSQYRGLAAEFGLTPSSRSRIKAGNGQDKKNPLAKYLNRS